MTDFTPKLTADSLIHMYRRAKERRRVWEAHWNECYDFALPLRATQNQPGAKTADKLFDGTAPDAVDQLAASLLANLTPPWSKWVGLMPGTEVDDQEAEIIAPKLEKIAQVIQSNFDRSNFAIELHQCFLDLVTAGTACLMLEESPLGETSAFRFTAVPLFDVVFEDSDGGKLNSTLRRLDLTPQEVKKRYPAAPPMDRENTTFMSGEVPRISIIEAVIPDDKGYAYMAVAEPSSGLINEASVLAEGRFESSPFLNFRWIKAPGEIYGRSPVMKALPDIKTANKVVELILKNASIAVTGIWQAEDDGVLNPATVKLVPGAIIPKAVGSKGLTPLEAPARFDTSNIVLENLRVRIRSALMVDKLGPVQSATMSATEVLERSADTARVLGATYGRLQSELLTPLIHRAMTILSRRGEVPSVTIDGRTIDIDYRSPLARRQAKEDAQNTLAWITTVNGLGVNALSFINGPRTARWLARAFGVPDELVMSERDMVKVIGDGALSTGPTPPAEVGGDVPLRTDRQLSIKDAISPLDTAQAPSVTRPFNSKKRTQNNV